MRILEDHLDTSTVLSGELVKMVRKLRWIGMEEEAKRMQLALNALPPDRRETVLAGPPSTD
jgi:DNA-directed RNA polymerase specialized sigma24 family protein